MKQTREMERTTVDELLHEVERTEHRLALFQAVSNYLHLYRSYGGNPPERLLTIQKRKAQVDESVLMEIRGNVNDAIRQERESLQKLLCSEIEGHTK